MNQLTSITKLELIKMRISHQYKFIFFSNPKTGSTSLRDLLTPYSDLQEVQYTERTEYNPFYAHITPKEVKEIFLLKNWDFDKYFKFTFVRNPWARLVSLYKMIESGKKRSKQESLPDFNLWVKTIKPFGIGGGGDPYKQRWRVYGTYSIEHYIKDDFDNILVDKVIRLEDIDQEIIPLLKQLNIPNPENIVVPQKNKRQYKSQSYTDFYQKETIQYVEKLYKYDIEKFKYHFGN